MGERAAVQDFWQWWSREGCDALTATTDPDCSQDQRASVAAELAARVDAIDDRLEWEAGPGGDASQHVLVVTAAGDPDVRRCARLWLLGAPPADGTWRFADTRQAVPDAAGTELVVDETTIDLGRMVVGARQGPSRVDITVHHPSFAELDEDSRMATTYLALDAYVGEEQVELWVGEVAASEVSPLDAFPMAHLGSVLRECASECTAKDGSPLWVLLQGTSPDGSPIVASSQVPLRQASAPTLTRYVGVFLPYAERTDEGLPGPSALDELRDVEDRITAAVGKDARLVAHQSAAGVRVLHLYADPDREAPAAVREVVSGWPAGDVQVSDDPGWAMVNHLSG